MTDPLKRIAEMVENATVIWDGDAPANDPAAPVQRLAPIARDDRGAAHVQAWRTLTMCRNLVQNDTDNGRRLILWFGENFRFVRDIGWAVWSGSHWEMTGGAEALKRYAQATARMIAHEALLIRPTPAERDAIEGGTDAERDKALGEVEKRRSARRKFAISSGNSARIASMIDTAAPHITIGVEQLDADAMLYNVENGTLRFSREIDPDCPDPDIVRFTGKVNLQPHARTDLQAKLAPVPYDPAAPCTRWLAFLARFQPKEDRRRFLQVYHGYAILGLMGAQKLVFNYGEGANGKSTFIEAICRQMGNYARTLNSESLTGTQQRGSGQATPDLAQLPGARMVRVSELPRGEPLKETLVKSLTGGEPMMVRHNFGNFFEFRPNFKPSMSGNDKPRIDGVDHGIWRRVCLVVWGVTIADDERRDMEEVLAEFWEERSGVLNWLIEGALIYLREGLQVPKDILDATAEYRADMDHIQGFIDSCITRTEIETCTVNARALYLAYEVWCIANAIKPWSEKAFAVTMQKKGFKKVEARVRYYTYIALHDVPDDPRHHQPRSPYGETP